MHDTLRINGDRLRHRLSELGKIGALPGGGVCRLALTDEDRQGRDTVMGWMRELGLEVTVDAMGNVFGLRRGTEDGPPVMTGSHIDTVRTGGLYDGSLGVLGGLEAIETLNDAGITTRRPLCVAFFNNEEGARFAPDMMGSLVYVGGMSLEEAMATEGIDGKTVGECMQAIGAQGDAPVGHPDVHAFIEIHVEQGPVLEESGITIGAVEKVQGISWTEFTLTGTSNHAGTTPMRLRHDAGYVAMATAGFVRDLATRLGGDQVGTVGALEIGPNLVNVVPDQARFTVDLRNTDNDRLQQAEWQLHEFITQLAEREGVTVERRQLARFDPVPFDPEMVDRVEKAARDHGLSVMRMPSGAGHDAQMLARVCPTSMIFVPSVDGISHNIDEYTAPEDLEAGANVLLQVLLDLAA
ncbi:Zn-dependent hydrolase [Aidingimonas halophila]|uniref:N-carbamoyl-L-amino-acid hydrolase n=1 Tax=Aidingimonas halophila TaxID=574349 RepID=A0A1H3GB31_9GAMM|nr:Zn-dependent hydrolase [Aidingimonas halophila]GHC32793.1 Zn-dependent hydrolase [Aidingimonas halophila]SDX99858.1 N-carbamoyl-L-amino-acid hydrolase [Aidingimonas halophila]